ncbi:hypothetical protein ACN47E_005474 [Coniothyrium glycines]
MPIRAFLYRFLLCGIVSVSVVNIFTKATSSSFSQQAPIHQQGETFVCPASGLAEDVLVVLRTGATESLEKVPVHFQTTLSCVPSYMIVSDMKEKIDGCVVHDVLAGVSEEIRTQHEDFKLYNHLQKHGRSGLKTDGVITGLSGSVKGEYLRTENDGWRLDKWKFLPMIDTALKEKPDAKWFVFIEADTYLGWHNLLKFLGNFDSNKPYYIGKHLFINDVEFGYGGAGFVLSNPAMQKISQRRLNHISEYEEFTKTHWVGDYALGKVLHDIDIPLHRAFPHFQGDSPATVDPSINKIDRNLWCYPAITHHHMSPAEIDEMWHFEQAWYNRHDIVLRHRDIFMELVYPKISTAVDAWDNMSDEKEYNAHDHAHSTSDVERNAWKSFDHCRALCEDQKDCIQFSFNAGSCGVSHTFRLGYASPGGMIKSGWMLDRVDALFRRLEDQCGVRDWFAPDDNTNRELKMRRKRGI